MDNYLKDLQSRTAVLEMRAQQAQLEAQIARVELDQAQRNEGRYNTVPGAVPTSPSTGKRRGRPAGKASKASKASNVAVVNKKKKKKKTKRTLSPAARKAIAAAQKRRWDAYRAASAASGKG